jgi:class 3 adenylate cyclase
MMGLSDRRLTLSAFCGRHRSAFHMTDPIDRLVRAISRRNSYALVWAQFGFAHLVVFGGLGLLWLYEPITNADFWLLSAISQTLVAIDNAISIKLTRQMWRPVWAWERGARDPAATVAAWTTLATLPLALFKRLRTYPLFFAYLPFMAFMTWKLDLPWWNFFVLSIVGSSVLACNLIIRYFTIEIFARPVLERIAVDLPDDFEIDGPGLPIRWRLFAAAPVINVVTALVVSGLSLRDGRFQHVVHLGSLGLSWLIAVVVSLTISLELIVLVVRSLGTSLTDLQKATDAVRAGDFTVRVPVVATDETGKLAQSFNSMLRGLEERGRLHEAFGAYVDPGLADRVLREGSELAGEEVEVTILFLDIRNFTAFAERAEPGAVVSYLNTFWQLVVPVLLRHGGQANKFIGDGLLAVFGAPERLEDHAERALNAALEMLELIAATYSGRVAVGIGVNSGSVVAGTVGGGGRVEFTVIGDTVNTAARVEAATRETGDDLLITDATKALLCQNSFEFEERPPVPLKGKSVVVRLWAPRRVAPVPAAQSAPQVPVPD